MYSTQSSSNSNSRILAVAAASLCVGGLAGFSLKGPFSLKNPAERSSSLLDAPLGFPQARTSLPIDYGLEELRRAQDALARQDTPGALGALASAFELLSDRGGPEQPDLSKVYALGQTLGPELLNSLRVDPDQPGLLELYNALVRVGKCHPDPQLYSALVSEAHSGLLRPKEWEDDWSVQISQLEKAEQWAALGGIKLGREHQEIKQVLARRFPREYRRYERLTQICQALAALESGELRSAQMPSITSPNTGSPSTGSPNTGSPSTERDVVHLYLDRCARALAYGDEYHARDFFGAALTRYAALDTRTQRGLAKHVRQLGSEVLPLVVRHLEETPADSASLELVRHWKLLETAND